MDALIGEQTMPHFVWPTLGHPGRVPLDALMPNPYQPRKEFDKGELASLASTMKEENGGEQREILTVREFSEEERALYPLPVRYIIISGERRWRAAHLAGLADIEIRVKKYASRAKEKLDMYMLNEGRVGLSDIENADYLAGLMEDFNLTTQEELGQLVGKDQMTISNLLALLKLSPKARALMLPSVPEYARLKRNVGVFLSRLSCEVQDDFAERMPKGRDATAVQQVRWMQEELKKTGEQLPTRLRKPSTIRQVLRYFAEQTERRSKELLEFENFDQLFLNSPAEQVLSLLGDVKDAQAEFADLIDRIVELSQAVLPNAERNAAPHAAREPERKPVVEKEASKAPTLPPAPKPAASKTAQAPASQALPKQESRPTSHTIPSNAGGGLARRVAPSPSTGSRKKEKTITYFNESRKVTDKVGRDKYVELWDTNSLGFQVDKKERPAWMPTREAALEDWDKYCD